MPKPKIANTICQSDEIKTFLFGGHCADCGNLNEKVFLENWHPTVFVIHSFIGKHLKGLYRAFDGDMLMALVMSEIWQYNLGRYFARAGQENGELDLNHQERRQALLPPCNTYSISQTLGIPNETVRRKVKKLIELGWVHRNGNGELTSTVASEERFLPGQALLFVREFVSHARHALALLGEEAAPPPQKSFDTKQAVPEKI